MIHIVYDGDCPFCRNFIRLHRLRDDLSQQVMLHNARDDTDEAVQSLWRQGYDLHEGMAVILDDTIYHGADAFHRLALMSGTSGLLNRLTYWTFRHPAISRLCYPMFKAARLLALYLTGKTTLKNPLA